MTDQEFWTIIARVKTASRGSKDRQVNLLEAELKKLPPAEIIAFQHAFDGYIDRAYTWGLWAAAYVIAGGCSDDGFIDFRSWLISMGRQIYESALADPENLANVEIGDEPMEDVFFEEFAYVAGTAYESKTSEGIPFEIRNAPADPCGEPWAEDPDILAKLYPRLWFKYGER